MAILETGLETQESMEGFVSVPAPSQGSLRERACRALGTMRMVAACALLLVLASLSFGCAGKADLPSDNVFDEMLACDVYVFAQAAGGTYESEWRLPDDGFFLVGEEEGFRVSYRLGRDYDDDMCPYKLTFSKSVYVPISDGHFIRVTKREVYSSKTGALRVDGISYWESDSREEIDLDHPERMAYGFRVLSAEEGESEIRGADADGLLDRIMGSPSEYFVELYFCCMDSSYSSESLGAYDDRRG